MKVIFIIFIYLYCCEFAICQDLPLATERQLEEFTQQQEAETEDDHFLQELEEFRKNPLDLNNATRDELAFFFLSPVQVESLVNYRELLGSLVSIYELQAIPGWDLATIRRVLPFVTVTGTGSFNNEFHVRSKKGEHQLLFRMGGIVERARGFKDSVYLGDPMKIFFRYRYRYKNLMQWGMVGDKDAGENFFSGRQKMGFDFYSFHFFARKLGIIESLALGDYTVNLGQGLIHWQGLAFGKGSEITSIKRQSPVIRPYHSAGEFNFLRGAAITLGKDNWRTTLLVSYRKPDANISYDSIHHFISSILTSGLHRSAAENADRSQVKLATAGGNISYTKRNLKIGTNGMYYQFDLPFLKRNEPYNLFSIRGKAWWNLSVDHHYTRKNIHVFGEAAVDKNFNTAFIEGIMISVHRDIDLAFLFRSIHQRYQSLYGNAFTENSLPSNESGLFTSISIRPSTDLKVEAYMDVYRFPWLKFRVNAPSTGSEQMFQFTYAPGKSTSVLIKFRSRKKMVNDVAEDEVSTPLGFQAQLNGRAQLNQVLSPGITLRARVEWIRVRQEQRDWEEGFFLSTDLLYKPFNLPYSFSVRVAFFETEGYESRIYAYENHVLYAYSIPSLSGKGFRYYLNLNYNLSSGVTAWLRWAQSRYSGADHIGSGWDEIPGRLKSDWTFQLRYTL